MGKGGINMLYVVVRKQILGSWDLDLALASEECEGIDGALVRCHAVPAHPWQRGPAKDKDLGNILY